MMAHFATASFVSEVSSPVVNWHSMLAEKKGRYTERRREALAPARDIEHQDNAQVRPTTVLLQTRPVKLRVKPHRDPVLALAYAET